MAKMTYAQFKAKREKTIEKIVKCRQRLKKLEQELNILECWYDVHIKEND